MTRLIHSDAFLDLVAEKPLVYIDAGARGGLEGPWAEIADDRIRVVAFEADPKADFQIDPKVSANIVSSEDGNRRVVAKALWSSAGSVNLHLAASPSSSSIHPPNFGVLASYSESFEQPRITKDVLEVESVALDEALTELGMRADFIKIDTQGSEFEILQGASHALDNDVFAVVAETWSVEVHKGQRLTADVLNLMRGHGFELFDMNLAAAWHRRRPRGQPGLGKRQIVGLDLLFFKNLNSIRERLACPAVAAKTAAIADMYGFSELAIDAIDISTQAQTDPALIARLLALRNVALHAQKQDSRPWWLKRLAQVFRGEKRRDQIASLHY